MPCIIFQTFYMGPVFQYPIALKTGAVLDNPEHAERFYLPGWIAGPHD